jgi:hypothetical protein
VKKELIFQKLSIIRLDSNYSDIFSKQKYVFRYVVTFLTNIVIITTNQDELTEIKSRVLSNLNKFNLILYKEDVRFIYNQVQKKLKFNYLGFTLYYVPFVKIRRGGLLVNKGYITSKKKISKIYGLVLLYPSYEVFKKMKKELHLIIRDLLYFDFKVILNKLNNNIKRFVNYFFWDNAYVRFRTLDGLIFRKIKKYLIRKYRIRGLRRPR